MIEEQIKEIVKRWQYEDGYIHVDDMVKELTNLLTQQREEAYEQGVYDQAMYWKGEVEDAVKSFAKYFEGTKFDMADVEMWLESEYGKK